MLAYYFIQHEILNTYIYTMYIPYQISLTFFKCDPNIRVSREFHMSNLTCKLG